MKTWSSPQPLDVLVCGFPIDQLDAIRPYGALRGNATRAFGLANNLARLQWKTGLVVDPGCACLNSPLIAEDLMAVAGPALAEAAAAANVLLLACTNLKTLRQRVPEVFTLPHPRKWVACCFDQNDGEDIVALTRGVIGISFNNDRQTQTWVHRGLGIPVHTLPYGVDENSYLDEAIQPAPRPTAVWVGALRLPLLLQRLVRFAEVNPECEVKVVSGLVFDQTRPAGSEGSLDHPYLDAAAGPWSRERFEEIVQRWCQRPAPENLRFLGPCTGQNAEILGSASLALGFSRRAGQEHDDSKILDYLRSGLPVFCDDGQPSHRFVLEHGHGCVMPFTGGEEQLRAGFQHCLELSGLEQRRQVAAQVRDRFGWPAVARQVAQWITRDRDDSAGPPQPRADSIPAGSAARPPLRLLYIPWIEGHTGALVKRLEASGGVEFVPLPLLDLIPGRPGAHRSEIMQLAQEQPGAFRRLLAGLLARVPEPVHALLLTVDWCAALRHTALAFRESGFPTVLVPHESVFAREDLYYVDPASGTNLPQAEMALLWGGLQDDVFGRRGLPAERRRVLGSPKLDFIRHYRSPVARTEFYARWGLPGETRVILFCLQPMDNQFDTPRALAAQSRAVMDCLLHCQRHGWRLVVRLPPARGLEILDPQLVEALRKTGVGAVDGSQEGCHLATPHDALFHADAVVSINSTMLLEAGLMDRPSLSLGYVACDQFWHRNGGLPLASNAEELETALLRAMSERRALFTEEGWRWIRRAFSPGEFDGNAARRILDFIASRWPEARRVTTVVRHLEAANAEPPTERLSPGTPGGSLPIARRDAATASGRREGSASDVPQHPPFISFLLPFIDRGQGPVYQWIMPLQASKFGPEGVAFIGDDAYFQAALPWGQELDQFGFRYRCPTREAWGQFSRQALPRTVFADLERRSRSMLDAFRILLTEDYAPLREALETSLAGICGSRKPEAILSWCHVPSLKLAAAKFGIPVIHNELGPLRAPQYQGTIYFDFNGVNGFTSAADQMRQFACDAAGWTGFRPLPLAELRELLIVRADQRAAGASQPTFKAGIALQVEDDSNLLAFAKGMNNFELIHAVRRFAGPQQILFRHHPHGYARYSDKLGVVDRSADSIAFLSRCEHLFTTNSSVAFESLLQGRPVTVLGDSPAAALSHPLFQAMSPETRLLCLNWLFVGYLVPSARLFDADYYRWRLTQPSLREIFERHLSELEVGRGSRRHGAPAPRETDATGVPPMPAPVSDPAHAPGLAAAEGAGRATVLFISHEASRTGAPIYLLHLLRWLRARTSLQCRVLLGRGGPLESEFRALADTFTPETFGTDGARLADVDLIYSNTCTNGALIEAVGCGNLPMVTHVHELDSVIEVFGRENFDKVCRHTTHFIACAQAVADGLTQRRRIPADRISVQHEMISVAEVALRADVALRPAIRARYGLPDPAFVIAACGTADRRKGADLFLQLAALLRRQFAGRQPLHFVWIGLVPNDQHTRFLRQECARLGLNDSIQFVGEQANPHALLHACDLFCLPSREDPFPLVMLEAGALGKPLVCFDGSGGAKEFAARGAGFAVPYLDVAAMAERCAQLIDDEPLRQRLGSAAAQLVRDEFDVEVSAPRVWARLQTLLPASPRGARSPAAASNQPADARPGKPDETTGTLPPSQTAAAPTVSIIIPTFNNLALTVKCLAALASTTPRPLAEIIIVDNGSTDGTVDFLQTGERAGRWRTVRNPRNLGFARGCNQGALAARGEFVLFLNNDTETRPGWLDVLVHAAREPQVGVVGAKLLYPDGTIQHAGIEFINGVPDHRLRHAPAETPEVNQRREFDMVTGACLLMPKPLFLDLGGFDEVFRNGVEDVDLCLRARAAGYKVVYEPKAVVTHHEGKSTGRFLHVTDNLRIFFARWQGQFEASHAFRAPRPPRLQKSETSLLLASVNVCWDGSFLDLGSLSHVNRELTRALSKHPQMQLTRLGKNAVPKPLAGMPTLLDCARQLRAQPPKPAQVTVRHAWPPNWKRPAPGAWVLIQPWEFGTLPQEWVQNLAPVDEIWVPSEYVRRVYVDSGVEPRKVHVVPNGIDPQVFRTEAKPMALATSKSFKFLFVGGTIFRKGPDVLLQAYLECFTAQDDVCLVIKDFGGHSVYAGQTFEAQVKAAQATPNAPEILYLNDELPPESLPGLYTACDCFVLPYRGEGFGLPVLEAMACGLPVVVTGGGATDDFATDIHAYRLPSRRQAIGREVGGLRLAGEGWLLEPLLPALVRQMQWVFAHRDEARAKGRVASDHVRREWTWDRAAQIAATRLLGLVAHAAPASTAAPSPAAAPKRAVIELPPVAKVGHLAQARELAGRKKYLEAWQAVLAALRQRPYHPEAFLLLAELAQAVGDQARARQLAERARQMAPKWKPARQFLKSVPHRGGAARIALPDDAILSAKAGTQPRLTVCLIVKNEERFIGQCLESVRSVADQIVVMDTGSTDWTMAIAARFGAEVYSCAWQDDFSAARNAVLAHAAGDWILMLDADEELTPEGRAALPKALQAEAVMAYRLPIEDVGHEQQGRNYVPRLFRNAPGLFYVGRVHEQVYSSVEVRREQWGLDNRLGTVLLRHHGYTPEMVKSRDKIQRNLRLLERAMEELPDEPNLIMNHGLELVRAGDRDRGVAKYYEAFQSLSAKPPSEVVPELRETLLTQLATQLMAVRNFESVVTVLNSPLARREELTASMHYLLGLACLELKQPAEAVTHLRQCLAQRHRPALSLVHPGILTEAPHHCLAMCLVHLKQLPAADAAFQAALEAAPTSRPNRHDYAVHLLQCGQAVEALKLWHQLASEQPEEVQAWHRGGQAALSQPEFLEVARDWTAEALKHVPDHPALMLQRAAALLLSQEPAAALPFWERVEAADATAAAGRRLCQVLLGQPISPIAPDQETAVSREWVVWYRTLLRFKAARLVEQLNARFAVLAPVLPSAARTLEAAVREANQMEAA